MIQKRVLNNGLKLVLEKIPYVKSVAFGVWIGTGSRNETAANNGVSHFIEHMLFKGTKNRTAKEIAESIDNLGGQLNAFTGKECTCFYAKTLDSHIETAIDVLADIIFNSNFAAKDIKLEKRVIFEEIGMYEDSPEDLVHDVLSTVSWENDALSYPILGTLETVSKLTKESMVRYMSENYTPDNAVISIAGNFDTDYIIGLIEKYFGAWHSKASEPACKKAGFLPGIKIKEKDIEQVHLCIGLDSLPHGDERLYGLIAVNNILGGGMSSKLFQRIRENKGLAYSIYSYPASYKEAGIFTIYAGMNPVNVREVLKYIIDEIRLLCKKGLSDEEIAKSKEQLKGNYILGLESTSSRMNSIGKSELILGQVYTPEEILEKIDKVDKDAVNEVIDMVFNKQNISLACVGNMNQDIDFAKLIKW